MEFFFSGERTIDETTRVDREKEKGKGNDTKILLSAQKRKKRKKTVLFDHDASVSSDEK